MDTLTIYHYMYYIQNESLYGKALTTHSPAG